MGFNRLVLHLCAILASVSRVRWVLRMFFLGGWALALARVTEAKQPPGRLIGGSGRGSGCRASGYGVVGFGFRI